MANQSITDFIKNFGGGTRVNRFNVTGTIGRTSGTGFNDFHVRSASLPAASVGAIPINFRGRTVSYPGDRVYLPWSIIVLDENPNEKKVVGTRTLYGAFHQWHESINSHASNTTRYTNPSNHFSSDVWTVNQLDTNGNKTIRQFRLHNCWPLAVGPIQLNMDQDNVLNSFAVTMLYSHFTYDDRK